VATKSRQDVFRQGVRQDGAYDFRVLEGEWECNPLAASDSLKKLFAIGCAGLLGAAQEPCIHSG
jgi:hypothetical protein